MLQNLRPTELIIIVLVIVLLFGAKKLPELAKAVGESLHILKKEVRDPEAEAAAGNVVVPQDVAQPATPAPSAFESFPRQSS